MTIGQNTRQALSPRRAVTAGVGNLVLSDVHFGAGIVPEQTGGENAYDERIAAARTIAAFNVFIQQMDQETAGGIYASCVVWLPGDIIEGFFGNLAADADGRLQFPNPSRSADRYSYVLFNELTKLGKLGVSDIQVVGITGNHGKKPGQSDDVGVTENYDLDFLHNLKARCDEQNKWNEKFIIGVNFPGSEQGVFPGENVTFVVYDTPFILCHGNESGFQVSSHGKRDDRYGRDDIRRAAKAYLARQIQTFKERAVRRGKQGNALDVDWDKAFLIHGHHHVSCPDPDERVLGCGSLRGIDQYANENQAVLRLEEPSALSFTTLPDGSVVNVRRIEGLDPVPALEAPDADRTPFKLVRWGVSEKIRQYIDTKAA